MIVTGAFLVLVGFARYRDGRRRIDAADFRPALNSITVAAALAVLASAVAVDPRLAAPARPVAADRPARLTAMPAFRAPRGTRDLLPEERAVFARLEATGTALATRYGYRPIETPLFEQAAVFERGIGSVTDVVEKELFRLAPRTEESEAWALRPEPTAGIVRAYIQHGMQTLPQPVKLTMTGPMFRYDRPQAGRYRQFWQFDVEAIGDAGPAVDAEIIELGYRFYGEVGVRDVEVQVNSIGDPACRPAYIAELTDVLPRPRRRPPAHRAGPPGAQRPPAPRLQGPGDDRHQRGGAADHRPAVRGVRGPLRRA